MTSTQASHEIRQKTFSGLLQPKPSYFIIENWMKPGENVGKIILILNENSFLAWIALNWKFRNVIQGGVFFSFSHTKQDFSLVPS